MALGISIGTLGVACGDDDGGPANQGGNGGSGASGGSGGGGGSGDAGSAGMSGGSSMAGEGGAGGGNGGAGGGNAGAGNAGAGNAGDGGASGAGNDPDSGVGDPDGGTVVPDASSGGSSGASGSGGSAGAAPVDSGVNGNCGGFTTEVGNIAGQNNQDVVIARVIFQPDDESAEVILRVVAAPPGFTFGDPHQLCWGPTDEECTVVDDGVTGARLAPFEFSLIVGTAAGDVCGAAADETCPAIDVGEGELFYGDSLPSSGATNPFAYVNWGNHDSVDPDDGGPLDALEVIAVSGNFWTDNESIDLGTDNAFFGSGATDVAAGFGTCTADQFTVAP